MRKNYLLMLCLMVAAGMAGCTQHSHSSRNRPANLAQGERVARQGRLPISYRINTPSTVRIDNLKTGQQVWQQSVPLGTHLLIDSKGIKIGDTWVYTDGLSKKDSYRIVLIRQ